MIQLEKCSEYGKDGKLTGPDRETVEVSMLALHLLQSCLVYVNTLLLQRVLADRKWAKRLTADDQRGLNALFWTNVNPYGVITVDVEAELAKLDSTGRRPLRPCIPLDPQR